MLRLRSAAALFAVLLVAPGCKEEGSIKVTSLSFTGVKAVDESRLKNALATRESTWIPWGKKYFFDRTRFDADRKRIEAFYADRGYPDARVTGFDVKLNDKQDAVDISVTIAEGEPVVVASVTFLGFDEIPPEHLDEMKKRTPLKVGDPRDRQVVVAAHEVAVNELRDHGYPYAKVATMEDDGPDGKHAAVTFTAEQGKLAHVGSIEIVGNKTVSERIIRRELTFNTGDLYRRSVMQDSQRRLYGLELFQFANIEPVDAEAEPDEVGIRVTVAEGKHQRANFGIGYGTEEKARVEGEYHHVNFLGGARSAGAHARWSSLDRGVRLDFNQPYFFRPHFSLGGEAQQWYTFTPAYNSTVLGAKATLLHRQSVRTSWSVSIQNEHTTSSIAPEVRDDPVNRITLIALGFDPRTLEQTGTLNAFGFDLQHSTADNVLNAHRGYQVAFHAENAGRFMPGTFNYYAMSADGRHYLPMTDAIVFASRVQIGNLRPSGLDQTQVPFSKTFFLGGATSIRGWGRFEVSPLTEAGLPIGGDSMFAFSHELRARLIGSWGGVAFLDGGNVWAKSWGVEFTDLRYAAGLGLRYQTPIGPFRFDVGWQLNQIPGLVVNGSPEKRHYRMHFSIGQAF